MKSISLLVLGGLLVAGPVATTSVASTPRTDVTIADHEADHAELFSKLRAYYDLENKIDLLVLQSGQSQALKRFAGMTLGDFSGLDKSLTELAKELNVTIGAYQPSSAADQQQLQALNDAAAKLKTLSGKDLDLAYLKLAKDFHTDVLGAVTDAATSETDEKVKTLLEDYKTKETSHLDQLAALQTQADNGTLDQGNSGGGSSGSGNGNGNGDGTSNGNGNGNGNTTGDNGNGNGNGNGTANGNGNGNGNSNGNNSCSNSCTCTCGASPISL